MFDSTPRDVRNAIASIVTGKAGQPNAMERLTAAQHLKLDEFPVVVVRLDGSRNVEFLRFDGERESCYTSEISELAPRGSESWPIGFEAALADGLPPINFALTARKFRADGEGWCDYQSGDNSALVRVFAD